MNLSTKAPAGTGRRRRSAWRSAPTRTPRAGEHHVLHPQHTRLLQDRRGETIGFSLATTARWAPSRAMRPTDRVVEIGCGIQALTKTLADHARPRRPGRRLEDDRSCHEALAASANVELVIDYFDLSVISRCTWTSTYTLPSFFQRVPDRQVTCRLHRGDGAGPASGARCTSRSATPDPPAGRGPRTTPWRSVTRASASSLGLPGAAVARLALQQEELLAALGPRRPRPRRDPRDGPSTAC